MYRTGVKCIVQRSMDDNFTSSNFIKCIRNNCTSSSNVKLDDILIIPFDNLHEDMRILFSYFLYKAPNICSVHSTEIPIESNSIIFEQMMDNRHFKYCFFCNSNAKIQKELERGHIWGKELCLKCKRYVCKRARREKNQPAESELNCFLRHIRNSIAHGRVYYLYSKSGVHIMFEDFNDSGNLSARIICSKSDLENWKKILENFHNL